MREHVFLCGLTKEQRSEFPDGTALSLEKKVGNLTLKLDQLRKRLVGSEPARLTDLLEISSYVFAADRTTKRGSLSDPGFGAEWRRCFVLVIAVRDLDFWQRSDVKQTLCEALRFLSEDWWRFEFVGNLHPIQLQEYLGIKDKPIDVAGGTSVLLFSGGLDSLAGAVEELKRTNRHVVLVSHRNVPVIGKRQQELAEQLAEAFPRRISHVWIDNSLTRKLQDREETQRTRSFFFTAMAAVAAHIETSDCIRFYENGVMSVNLPFATQVVGARASRSTHPRSLQLLGRVVEKVSSHAIEISNPFIWSTKAEIVGELASTDQAQLITRSISCTRSRTLTKKFQNHCGTCVQCLQRRMSTLAGGAAEFDEGEGYETDFIEGPREDGEDRAMAVGSVTLALECADISERDFLGRFAEQVSWVMQAFPVGEREDIGKKLFALYRQHGLAVRSIFADAISNRAQGVLDRTLAPSSLLALVMASRFPLSGHTANEAVIERLSEPAPQHPVSTISQDEIFIAVDGERHSIRISDRLEVHGHAIFPIMKLLIQTSIEDRAAGLISKNHRCLKATAIADKLGDRDDAAVRAAIKRARIQINEASMALVGIEADPNEIIERDPRKGYRLNPKVKPVTIDEFRNL